MGGTKPQDLGGGVWMIDLMEAGRPRRTACYVVRGDRTGIIEVGSSLSRGRILDGLRALGLAPGDVDYIVVTHVHLDHAGGTGHLLPAMPNAAVVCHPLAQRHLADPSRLLAGARAVYGERLEAIFGPVLPVPAERLLVRQDGESVDLGQGHALTFYDAPGHARHHLVAYDPAVQTIFSGDAIGIRYASTPIDPPFSSVYAASSPSDFDLRASLATLERLSALGAERVCHAHFGCTEPAAVAFERTRATATDFDRIARRVRAGGGGWKDVAAELRTYIQADLRRLGCPDPHFLALVERDIEVNAMGLFMALEREDTRAWGRKSERGDRVP